MSNVSTGRPELADVESSLNNTVLAELIVREVHFPRAGEEVEVVLPGDYAITQLKPTGEYRARVVSGNRRAIVRRGPSTWTWETVYFVSNVAGVYADIAIQF